MLDKAIVTALVGTGQPFEIAKKFYGETIGWTFDGMPMPDGTYWVANMGGQPVVGLFPIARMRACGSRACLLSCRRIMRCLRSRSMTSPRPCLPSPLKACCFSATASSCKTPTACGPRPAGTKSPGFSIPISTCFRSASTLSLG